MLLQPPPLANTTNAARWLKVPAKWLEQEAREGRVPHLKTGDTFVFNVEAVERVLVERAACVPERAAVT
ncbi:MAG: hypothetical protein ACYS0D_04280 [Planctomycetota bacterium]|jgi:hypothetical protein